jgi:capsular exopolysaccharide synthesis family protein
MRGSVAKIQIPNSSARDDAKDVSIANTMRTLYTHRVAMMITLSIFLAAGLAMAFLPDHYEADGTLWVEPGESSALEVSSLASMLSGQTSDIVASEVDAMQSRTMLLRVAKDLNLVNNREFWGPFAFIEQPDPPDRTLDDHPKTRDDVYKKISKSVDVENDGKDEILTISVKTISPLLSAKITNTLINDYLRYLFEMRYGATKRSSGWLIDQLGDLKQRVDADQTELTALQNKLGVMGFNPTTSSYIYGESLDQLMKSYDQAKIERILAEAKLRFLKESSPNLIEGEINILPQPDMLNGQSQSLLQSLRASQAQAQAGYARMLTQFGSNYPEVQQQKAQLDAIDKQISDEEQRIVNQAQLSYNAASANEKMTSDNVDREKSKVFDSSDSMVRFSLLMQDYQRDRSLYEGLISKLQEAGVASGLEAGDIDIVDLADVPGKPIIYWTAWVIVPASIILGLILGVFLALWLGTLDRRIRGPEQVEKDMGLPLLAQVPHVKFDRSEADKSELPQLIVTARRSHYAEAIQSLRASLLLAKPGSAPKVILVTSATPNEGKSTTVVNLAATFARHGSRVLVVDCDLRRGTVAKRLRLSAAKGLTSVLTRQMSLEAALQEVPGVPGMFVLADGPRPPDPAVLIGSDEMRRFMEECREHFDFVIVDSPPVLGISDALHLGQYADSVILVIRESVSNRKAVEESAAMMVASHLPLSGFVFNDVDPRASSYSYGYSYRDYYRGYYTDDAKSPRAEVSE